MATYTFLGTTSTAWTTAANWSPSVVPTSADTAIFDSSSLNCLVNANVTPGSVDFTNYTRTLTISNNISINNNLTLGANMVISGGGSIFVNGSGIWIGNGKTWPNNIITQTAIQTITISGSTFNTNTLTLNIGTTFAGVYGFAANSLVIGTAGATHTLQSGNTYTVTSGITAAAPTAANKSTIQSSGAAYAKLTLLSGTTNVGFVNATWIDSSAGQTIWSYGGTLSNTLNWKDLSVFPLNASFTFVGS